MRIHLPLHPHHFALSTSTSGPLARIGGDLVVIELQGQLEWEGDKANGVIGVLGLDRPPTLHIGEHHLLHGKMSNLPKPYAVIRKAAAPQAEAEAHALEGDAADEESDEEREVIAKKRKAEDEDEDEVLFPDAQAARAGLGDMFSTPTKAMAASSDYAPSSPPRDYSSDLSSPPNGTDAWGFPAPLEDEVEEEREEKERQAAKARERREKRRRAQPERTRYYEVVAVVRKKVVFALRPEPLVAATQLPE